MSTLTTLAKILADLRSFHNQGDSACPGPENCPLLHIMADVETLMEGIARAADNAAPAQSSIVRSPAEPSETLVLVCGQCQACKESRFNDCPERTVLPRNKDAFPAYQGITITDIPPEEIAHTAIRAAQQLGARFMPATRLCCTCDAILPKDQPLTLNKCHACRNEF